ncbi:hypothetical protein OEZ85_008332 [Tetradesmus obliquus]|uniref:FAS1 domain-containing protein n=1 Tax=Tetradesmus obliquus TaxID=3088 RepID=A0ABY8TJ23_TETOB|nr:hypothetical protein OEZ85_008332 [Tetradesmus obliquus]
MLCKSVRLAWIVLGLVSLQEATAQTAQAGSNTSLIGALESNGFKQLAGMFGTLRLKDDDIPTNLNLTILAPTDQAIQDFSASMGLSLEELRARPGLVDTLLSYHVIPGRKLTGAGLVAGGPPRTAKPLSAMSNPQDVLRFQRLANGTITVTDVQNNTAHVAGQPLMLPRANVFPVDRVLLNGDVFTNVTTLLQFHPEFSSLAALMPKAPGLAGSFRDNTFNHTLLAPTNDALAAASALVPSDEQGLTQVLQYHVIAQPGTLPDNFTQGAPLSTLLPGHNVVIRYRRVTVPARFNSSRNTSSTTATVEPEAGSPDAAANVTSTNLFSGKNSMMWQSLQDSSEAMSSGSAVDAGDEF